MLSRANPNSRSSDARPSDATLSTLPLRLALPMHRRTPPPAASACHCVPRNVRSKLIYIHKFHKSTVYLRLPRFRRASHIHAHAHSRFLAQGPSGFSCRARFPAPIRGAPAGHTIPHACHAKCTSTMLLARTCSTIPHACHAKRTRDTPGETLFVANPNGTAPRGHTRAHARTCERARTLGRTRREHGPPHKNKEGG